MAVTHAFLTTSQSLTENVYVMDLDPAMCIMSPLPLDSVQLRVATMPSLPDRR